MTFYQHESRHTLKWILALVVFVLAMTITFDDVYGVYVPGNSNDGTGQQTTGTGPDGFDIYDQDRPDGQTGTDDDPPPEVPEPATLILLGSGLAAMHALRRRNKNK